MEQPREIELAVRLADKVLDRPYADPDDDLAMLARQFLRTLEAAKTVLLPMAKGYAAEHDVGKNREMVQQLEEHWKGLPFELLTLSEDI